MAIIEKMEKYLADLDYRCQNYDISLDDALKEFKLYFEKMNVTDFESSFDFPEDWIVNDIDKGIQFLVDGECLDSDQFSDYVERKAELLDIKKKIQNI